MTGGCLATTHVSPGALPVSSSLDSKEIFWLPSTHLSRGQPAAGTCTLGHTGLDATVASYGAVAGYQSSLGLLFCEVALSQIIVLNIKRRHKTFSRLTQPRVSPH